MVTIEVNNSFSQIKGLTTEQLKKLQKLLSYQVNPEAARFSGGFVRSKSLVDNKGFFPTGLLHRVCVELNAWVITPSILENRARPISTPGMFKIRSIT